MAWFKLVGKSARIQRGEAEIETDYWAFQCEVNESGKAGDWTAATSWQPGSKGGAMIQQWYKGDEVKLLLVREDHEVGALEGRAKLQELTVSDTLVIAEWQSTGPIRFLTR